MSWWDSMNLRRRADKTRFIGWINLAVTCVVCIALADGVAFIAGRFWAAAVMVITYGAAHLIDKRAERVVGR